MAGNKSLYRSVLHFNLRTLILNVFYTFFALFHGRRRGGHARCPTVNTQLVVVCRLLHVNAPVTKQRQTLTKGRSSHFPFLQLLRVFGGIPSA